jgi:hypothetical protein
MAGWKELTIKKSHGDDTLLTVCFSLRIIYFGEPKKVTRFTSEGVVNPFFIFSIPSIFSFGRLHSLKM